MDAADMGSTCGQKKAAAQDSAISSPTHSSVGSTNGETLDRPEDIAASTQAAPSPVQDGPDQPSDPELDMYITYAPTLVPFKQTKVGLPMWLKTILKPDDVCLVDPFELLEVYHNFTEPPYLADEQIIQLVLRVVKGAQYDNILGKLWLRGVRWMSESEADYLDARLAEGYAAIDAQRAQARAVNGDAAAVGSTLDGATPAAAAPSDVLPAPPPNGLPDTASSSAPAPQTVDEILAARPRRDFDEEYRDFKASLAFESAGAWVKTFVVQEEHSGIHARDVARAYSAAHAHDLSIASLDDEIVQKLLLDVFPDAKLAEIECPEEGEDRYPLFILGLKWKKLEASFSSLALPHIEMPEVHRNSAHKLLHIDDPERTRLWLKMLFKPQDSSSIGLASLRDYYDRIFWRWADTHPHLEAEAFYQIVSRAFRGTTMIEVSPNYRVVAGLGVRNPPRKAKEAIARSQKVQLRRLQRAGEIDPPQTAFAQKLLQDPLLMRANRDSQGRLVHGPMIARLHKRMGVSDVVQTNGGLHAPLPFGDEEPGFPGLSIKRVQVQHKGAMEDYKNKLAAQAEANKAAGIPCPEGLPRPAAAASG